MAKTVFIFILALCASQAVGEFSSITLKFIRSTGLEERDFHCINNVAYYITDSQWKTCLDSVKFCDMVNMKLLATETQLENEYLRMRLEELGMYVPYWSSGQRMGQGGWVWSAMGKAINYMPTWSPQMPTTGFPGDLCVAMALDGWYSLPCDSEHFFICEWHPPPGEMCDQKPRQD